MPKKIRNLLLLFAFALGVALVVFILAPPRAATYPPLPNPNGYDDFLKASRSIPANSNIYDATTNQDRTVLRDLLATNAEALRLIHLGLTRQCSIPTEEWVTNFNSRFNDLAGLKRVGQLLAAEGKFAEQENHPGDAAVIYLDTIRYGDDISRGGFLIHRLVGIACESLGMEPLIKLVPKLTCEQARPIIAGLETIDRTGVTWSETLSYENALTAHEMRKSMNPIRRVAGWYLTRESKKRAEIKNEVISARLRLLAAELALRCYRADEGKAPDNLTQLVPKYLQTAPEDPFGGKPLVYHPDGTNWQLSSVGLPGTNGTRGAIKLKMPDE